MLVNGQEQSLYGPELRLEAQAAKMSPFGGKDTIDSGIMCDLPITGIEVILSTRHNMSQGPALVDSKTNKKAGPTNMVVAITCTRKVRRKK